MRSGMVIEGGFYAGKNHKTAFRFSIIDFYFVTAFYSLYDICMADMKTCFLTRRHEEHVFRQEDMY